MKSRNLLGLCSLLALFSACGNGAPKYDATGTFETTEVLVSAEASGRLLYFDIEEGMLLKAGEEVGVVDTVQLYLKKLQLEASLKSVEEQRPDILKQVAATKEQISAAQRERNRVANLLKVGAANQKQLDDAEDQLEVLRKQLVAQNSTLSNSHQSLTWQSSSVGIPQATCCAELYLVQQSPEPDVAKFIRRYSGCTGGRPVEEVPHHLSDNRHCTGKVRRSGRTHSYGHSAFQSGRYGTDVPSCLHHLRTTVAGKAGTESNRLLRLRHR